MLRKLEMSSLPNPPWLASGRLLLQHCCSFLAEDETCMGTFAGSSSPLLPYGFAGAPAPGSHFSYLIQHSHGCPSWVAAGSCPAEQDSPFCCHRTTCTERWPWGPLAVSTAVIPSYILSSLWHPSSQRARETHQLLGSETHHEVRISHALGRAQATAALQTAGSSEFLEAETVIYCVSWQDI